MLTRAKMYKRYIYNFPIELGYEDDDVKCGATNTFKEFAFEISILFYKGLRC